MRQSVPLFFDSLTQTTGEAQERTYKNNVVGSGGTVLFYQARGGSNNTVL